MIRVGIIGAGYIGRKHALGIQRIINGGYLPAQLQAVCDLDEEKARRMKEECGFKKVYSDFQELIRSRTVDAVFICTPTQNHLQMVREVARARKPVFCEKPLGRNYTESIEIARVVHQAKIPNQLGLILRYTPPLLWIKNCCGNSNVGHPMAFVLRDDQYFPIQGRYASTWRKQREVAGGGTLIEHSIHDVDLMAWIFGKIRAVFGYFHFGEHQEVEDLASAQIWFHNGAVGHLTSIWHNMLSRESCRDIELFYENAYFSIEDEFLGPIRIQQGNEPLTLVSPQQILEEISRMRKAVPLHLYQEIAQHRAPIDYHFLTALRNGHSPTPDFGAGLAAHRTVEAIYQSASRQREFQLGQLSRKQPAQPLEESKRAVARAIKIVD